MKKYAYAVGTNNDGASEASDFGIEVFQTFDEVVEYLYRERVEFIDDEDEDDTRFDDMLASIESSMSNAADSRFGCEKQFGDLHIKIVRKEIKLQASVQR
jgi:hypothetical protein